MKHIKTLAAIVLFLTVNMVSAQESSKKWPALNTVKEVATRIQKNIDDNNPYAFQFSETLKQHTAKLAQSEIPSELKNAKTQATIKTLQTKTEQLSAKSSAKASPDELKKEFAEIQTLIASLTETKK